MTYSTKDFAKLLKHERELHSWSQEKVAAMLGTTAPNVSRWERGVTLPGLYFRQKLSELFGKTAEELSLLEAASEGAAQPPERTTEELYLPPLSPAVSSSLWNLPHQRNSLFTGREETLLRLHKALNADNARTPIQIQAISGLGGIGKTELALEYAYRYSDEYRFILWIQAETRDALILDLVAIAKIVNSPEKELQAQCQAIKAVRDWLDQHTDWLLIIDNIEEFSLLREFVPFKRRGHIILTTCSQSTGPFVQRIDLQKMEPVEGALFLLRRAKYIGPQDSLEHASPADRAMAAEISQFLDNLPLALDQAGAYIEEAACSLSHYFCLLQSYRAVLLDLRNLSGGMNADHPRSMNATLSLSFERIKQAIPAAIDFLQLCAFLYPDAIPEEMITGGASHLTPLLRDVVSDPPKYDAMIAELRRYSLLYRNLDTKTFSIHRLVQAVLRDSMDEALQRQWAKRAVQIVSDLSRLRCTRGEHVEAELALQQAIETCQNALGPEHSETVWLLDELKEFYATTCPAG